MTPALAPPSGLGLRLGRQSARLQLAATFLFTLYFLLAGGVFDATVRYRVQLLNTVVGSALGLAWLGWLWQARRGPVAAGLAYPLAAAVLAQWLATAASAQPRLSLEAAASVTAWAAGFVLVLDLLAHGWPRTYVMNSLILVALLLTVQGLLEAASWYARWLADGAWPAASFRLVGLLGNANLTAGTVGLLLPVIVSRAALARGPARLALAALVAGMGTVLFFTSSRGAWLATGLGLAGLAVLPLTRPTGRARLASAWRGWRAWRPPAQLLVVAALAAGGVLLGGLIVEQFRHPTHTGLLASRQQFWRAAWQIFLEQPITGGGPGLFPWFYSRIVSVPPGWFAPHAHSLPLQVLSDSGLLGLLALAGLVAAGGWQLARRWRVAPGPELAGLAAGLLTLGAHHLFDYLFGTPVVAFLAVVVAALAFSQPAAGPAPTPVARPWAALAAAPGVLVPLAVYAFALRGAALNTAGVELGQAGQWEAAAVRFEQAAALDPGLSLYTQAAAYARTRAGQPEAALSLWQRAGQAEPYWAVPVASEAALRRDAALAAQAVDLAPESALYLLNAGVLAEQAGNAAAAHGYYRRTLALSPSWAEALFWQETPLRQAAAAEWLAETPESVIGQAARALVAGQAVRAAALYAEAVAANPTSPEAAGGLARARLALGDLAGAEEALAHAQNLQVFAAAATFDLHLAQGDVYLARGEVEAAMREYELVFSLIYDYGALGPGTYGYPQRYWYVFHREALPADLIPEIPRADVTAPLASRFVHLALWHQAEGRLATACLIIERIRREAPTTFWPPAELQACAE